MGRRRHPHLHQRAGIFYFFRRDGEGKRFEESLRTRDPEIANGRYQQRMEEIRSGHSPNHLSDCTLEQAIEFWLERRQPQIARGSYHSEQSIARNLQRILGKDRRLRSLADIDRFHDYQHLRLREKVSAKTVNNELQVLAGILRAAHLGQRVRDYKPLRTRKSDMPDALTTEESKRLLQTAATAPDTAVVPFAATLAWSTGLRSGEIKQLRLGDLHHDEPYPFLTVRRATTKSDAGARRVALDRIAVWSLTKLVDRAALIGSRNPEDHLLPTDRTRHTRLNDPLHGGYGFDPAHPQSSWAWEWRQFQGTAGITHRRFHDFRHSYITRAAEAGVPIAVVQAQVGHMSAEMIRWYTHISARAQDKAAKQIEAQSLDLLHIVIPEAQIRAAGIEPAAQVARNEFVPGALPRSRVPRDQLRSRCRTVAHVGFGQQTLRLNGAVDES